MVRVAAAVASAAAVVVLGGGIAGAGVDSVSSIVDHDQRNIQAIESDTRIDFVPPLDNNPMTREWFHSGTAGYQITGDKVDDWHGHITIGYMVGYPATFDGKLKFQYQTPGLEVEVGTNTQVDIFDLIPRAGVEMSVGFGPGIQTVECAGGDISGAEGSIRMSGFHGTVTGVLGQVSIRPFVKVVSNSGDTVVTYGPTSTI
ncbi:MspA family porin [Nocardia sp. alder85J]|uniref:MspA family porin n=1 Tax=Nocardia sp. alder85J TaxID=2862949 RepID=UPI001CD40059|nr:MspA family porin [Nocardia sp. alder85J]MCX4093205.1 MspA family porin [Nocardia sp. alder85J]